jgi:hypothetical protein
VLKPFFPDCSPPDEAARMLAVCCIRELKNVIPFLIDFLKFNFFTAISSDSDIHQLLLGEVGNECSRYIYLREAACSVHYHCSWNVSVAEW